jgi:hypothetical protein
MGFVSVIIVSALFALGRRWCCCRGSAARSCLLSSGTHAVAVTTVGIGSGCANLLPPTLMADPDAVPTLITFLGRDDPGFHPSRHSKP